MVGQGRRHEKRNCFGEALRGWCRICAGFGGGFHLGKKGGNLRDVDELNFTPVLNPAKKGSAFLLEVGEFFTGL